MADSVGPLKVALEAEVGDFAAPVRRQLDAVGRELRNFGPQRVPIEPAVGDFAGPVMTAVAALRQPFFGPAYRTPGEPAGEPREPRQAAGFPWWQPRPRFDAAAGSFENEWTRATGGHRPSQKAFEDEEAKRHQSWVDAMRGTSAEPGPLRDANGFIAGALSPAQLADQRQRVELRQARQSSPWGMSTWTSPGRDEIDAAVAAPESERAPGPREGGPPSGRGRLRQWGLEGMRGIVGRLPYEAAEVVLGSPAMQALGAGAIAYHAGSEARQAAIAGASLGMTSGEYSRFERQSEWAGSSIEETAQGVKHLRGLTLGAQAGVPGGEESLRLIDELGIHGLSTAEALKRLGDVLEGTSEPTKKMELAVRLFGDQASTMIDVLRPATGKWATSPLGQAVGEGFSWARDNAQRGNRALYEGAKGAALTAWDVGTTITGSFVQGARYARAGYEAVHDFNPEPFASLSNEGISEQTAAKEKEARDYRAFVMGVNRQSAEALAQGPLLDPAERLRQRIQGYVSPEDPSRRVPGIADRRGKYAPGDKKRDDELAGRDLALAVADYQEALRPRGHLAAAETTGSVAGAGMIAEAHFQTSGAPSLAETNDLLVRLLGANQDLVRLAQQQANFRQGSPQLEGP
jgi:hypothetical protein